MELCIALLFLERSLAEDTDEHRFTCDGCGLARAAGVGIGAAFSVGNVREGLVLSTV